MLWCESEQEQPESRQITSSIVQFLTMFRKSNQELLNTDVQRPVLCSCIFIIVTITGHDGHEQIQGWQMRVEYEFKASVQGWQQSASLSQSELAWFNRHHFSECYDVNPSKNNQNQGKLHQALSSFWPCSENLIKNSSTLMFSVQCSVLVFSSLSQSLVMTVTNKYKDDGNACGIWIQSLSTRMTTVCVTVSIGISMVQQTSLAECYDVNPSKNNQNQGKLHQALSSFWPCSENLIKNSSTLMFSVQCSVLVFSSLSQSLVMTVTNKYKDDGNACGIWIQSLSTRMTTVCVTVSIGIGMVQQTSLAECYDVNPSKNNQNQGKLHQALSSFWPCSENLIKNSSTLMFSVQCSVLVFSSLSQSLVMTVMNKYKDDGNACGIWIQSLSTRMTTVCVTVSIGISMVQQTSLAECYDVNPSKNNQNQGKLHQALSSFWPCSENLIKNSSTLMFSVQCSVLVFSSLSQSLVMTVTNKYKDDGNACGIWIQSLSTRMTTVCVTVSIGISMVQQTSLAECYDVNPSKNNQNQGKLHQALSSFWPCSENLIKNSSTLMFSVQCSVLVFSSLSQSLVMTVMNKYKDDGNACGIWIQSLSTRMTTVCVTVSIGISMVQQTSLFGMLWCESEQEQPESRQITSSIVQFLTMFRKSNQELLNTDVQRPVLCSCIFIIVTITGHDGHEQIQGWRKCVWNMNSKPQYKDDNSLRHCLNRN